jgi:hypothetical protein
MASGTKHNELEFMWWQSLIRIEFCSWKSQQKFERKLNSTDITAVTRRQATAMRGLVSHGMRERESAILWEEWNKG